MTNEERRELLAKARVNTVYWAERAQEQWPMSSSAGEEYISMATMWANVAQALKTGDAHADTPDH